MYHWITICLFLAFVSPMMACVGPVAPEGVTQEEPRPNVEPPSQEPPPTDPGTPDGNPTDGNPTDGGATDGGVPEPQKTPPCVKDVNYGRPCYVGQGACENTGNFICTADGLQIKCSASPKAATPEICDKKDNDCDGQVDEDEVCGCEVKSTRTCYTGPPSTQGKGPCKAGTQTCQADGTWSTCVGEVVPQQESCNGLDDNCDGKIDENCPCQLGQTRPCGSGVGECVKGTQSCVNGQWSSACQGANEPKTELCDGKDNDCDGMVDEDFPEKGQVCQLASQKGECAKGTYSQCTMGSLVCTSSYTPTNEICDNNKDDDCDGQIDENPPCICKNSAVRACGSSQGACQQGTQTCQNNQWGPCVGETKPTTETCDGKDNDCNGKVDDGLTAPKCQKQLGACAGSVQQCGGASGWAACTDIDYTRQNPKAKPGKETDCDGIDNNCDGQVDESCSGTGGALLMLKKYPGGAVIYNTLTSAPQDGLYAAGWQSGFNEIDGQKIHFPGLTGPAPANAKRYLTGYYLLSRYDNKGKLLWHVSPTTPGFPSRIQVMTSDASGNVYVAGVFAGELRLGSNTLSAQGVHDIFVGKLDATGKWVWSLSLGSSSDTTYSTTPAADSDGPTDIAVDASGNVYLTGHFSKQALLGGGLRLSGMSFYGIIDNQGKWRTAKSVVGNNTHYATGIHPDGKGGFVVTGIHLGSVTFGSHTVGSLRDWSVFAAHQDSQGNWTWASGGAATKESHDVRTQRDASGNLYFFGSFEATARFGTLSLFHASKQTFVAVMDDKGQWKRAQALNITDMTFLDFAVAPSGSLFFSGTFFGKPQFGANTLNGSPLMHSTFVAKMDTTGKWVRAAQGGSGSTVYSYGKRVRALFVDAQEQAHFVGGTGESQHVTDVIFGVHKLPFDDGTLQYNRREYIAKLANTNAWAWLASTPNITTLKKWGSTSSLKPGSYQAVKDTQGHLFLRGRFYKHIYLNGTSLLTNTITKTSHYVAKFDAANKLLWTRSEPEAFVVYWVFTSKEGDTYFYGNLPANKSATFGSIVVPQDTSCSDPRYCAVFARLDRNGKWNWAWRISSRFSEQNTHFVDQKGRLTIYYTGSNAFHQWDTKGTFLGAKTSNIGPLTLIQSDAQNNIYLGGYCQEPCKLGTNQVSRGINNVVILKTNEQLSSLSMVTNFYSSRGEPRHLLFDSSGNLYAHLYASSTFYNRIYKCSPTGQQLWVDQRKSSDFFLGVKWNAKGELLFYGQSSVIQTFGSFRLTPQGSQLFTATLNTSGTWTDAKLITPPNSIEAHDILLGPKDELFLFGKVLKRQSIKQTQLNPYTTGDDLFLQYLP